MTDKSGTVGGAGAGFDPARLYFRTRDGRAIDRFVAFRMTGWIGARQYTWDLRGACSSGMSRDNLVNIEHEAPPPAVEDEGETDAASEPLSAKALALLACGKFNKPIERHHPLYETHRLVGWVVPHEVAGMSDALFLLDEIADVARRAALVPDAVPVAQDERIVVRRVPFGCNEQDLLSHDKRKAVIIGEFPTEKAAVEWINAQRMPTDYFVIWEPPTATPAPVSPAGGEVSEAEVERLMAYAVMCERRDLRRNEPERWREYLPWVRRYAEEFAAAPKVGPAILTAEKVKAWREEPAVRDAVKHGVQRS